MLFEVYTYQIERDVLESVLEILNLIHNSLYKVNNLESLPVEYVNRRFLQFRADIINRWLGSKRKYLNSIMIGILNIDAYIPPLNFVFGAASPYYKVATVYLPQLRYSASQIIFKKRVRKEVLHEFGHLFGLRHCENRMCVMSFSNSIHDVDTKRDKFCEKHFNQLISQGIMLDKQLMMRTK